jgi:hypothetical protein
VSRPNDRDERDLKDATEAVLKVSASAAQTESTEQQVNGAANAATAKALVNGHADAIPHTGDPLGAERKLIDEALAKRKVEPEALFDAKVLMALAKVKRQDVAAWGGITTVIRNTKAISIRALEAAMDDVQKPEIQGVMLDEKPKLHTAGDLLSDAPCPSLLIPTMYSIDEHGTYLVAPAESLIGEPETPEKQKIAFNPILITEKLIDIDDGHESLRLAWRVRGRWSDKVVDRATALDSRKVVELAKVGFPVGSDNANSVSRYLHVLEACNSATLSITQLASHLGWVGPAETRGFLCGGSSMISGSGEIVDVGKQRHARSTNHKQNLVLFKGQTAGEEQVINGFHTAGTFDGFPETLHGGFTPSSE